MENVSLNINEYKLAIKLNLQFFAQDGPGGEKTEPATNKKLKDVRKEGQVAKSKEIITAVSLLSIFILLKIYVAGIGNGFLKAFNEIYSYFETVTSTSGFGLESEMAMDILKNVGMMIITIIAPVLIVGVVIAILGNALQQSWMVTAKPLKPKASKISPLNGFKRMFSFKQVFELIKAIAMMTILAIVVWSMVKKQVYVIYSFYDVSLYTAIVRTGQIIIDLGIRVSLVFLIIGVVDLIYQRHKFKNDNMMTKQEIKDEYKDSEGDPQVKGMIRRRMNEISRRRMMQQLPEADVVITNPTHFAVALKYDPESGKAPIVIAKGADYLAFQIKDKAKEYNIEIVENKPLARILYHNIEIGEEIPPELYVAVAEILAAVMKTKNRNLTSTMV
ncbi:flagellar biosynthesis protein FlhB [Lachnospira multipara]|jgi:flagellar biosynthetic protein FlhB|uniref:Flagellar biosynthetic protein FlhB n=1 Tax=Lachnospira multipara TaxID=28051 RepID=A0A1H5UQ45_9FIRM|nr:flagellar biosynthesis protein FlhB [Lachnospira multipara]MBQ2472874.1 flagellar biosynthesis protein FlhB [Lachnospira sp.]SEF77179.1 flagellar biosynthetic protein FlhB [Lachnospira multipara]